MRSMKIEVHKWATNIPGLLDDIPMAKRAKTMKLEIEEQVAVKALGLVWDVEQDSFRFLKGPSDMENWTLRTMCSSAGRLYDPLGLVSPTTLPGKLLIQNAWRYQGGWDAVLPEALGKKMSLYCQQQGRLDRVQIPRFLGGLGGEGKLVLFSDASRVAQAAAAYWVSGEKERPEEGGDPLQVQLIKSKVKLTGLRQHEHIGRLELVAAVMSVMLAVKICIAYRIPLDSVTYFTDSMTVLYWLTTSATMSVYAGHRVSQICERSHPRQWKYVRTDMNPSDIPTRGLRAEDLAKATMWWEGPEFLKQHPSSWPPQPHIRETEDAAAEIRTAEEICKGIILETWGNVTTRKVLDQVRSRRSGLRAQGFIIWCVYQALYKIVGSRRFCLSREGALKKIMLRDQMEHLTDVRAALEKSERPRRLLELQPRLDDEGIIRVSSGIHPRAAYDWDMKFPILLDGRMAFT